VEIYDPTDDSLIGDFGLTAGGWDNWRAKRWERCFMVVREPTPEPTFLFPDTLAQESLLRMELWVKEFDEYSQQPKSLYGAPRNIIEYAIAVNNEVTADMQRLRLMTVEDRLLVDETYQRLKAEREQLKKVLVEGNPLGRLLD
jgi:hypothetical protein